MRRGWGERVAVRFGSLAWLVLGALLACEPGAPLGGLRSFPVGVVSGTVRLADGAPLPAYAPQDVLHDPLVPRARPAELPAECEEANRAALTPVGLSPQRGLSGMVVAASDFSRNRPRDPAAQRVRIERCRLQPATIAMTRGDRLLLENRDAFPFAPLFGPAYRAKALPPGEKLFVPTWPGTLEPLSCSSDAPCGRSDVYVFNHPVHAVTGESGAFRIEGFPAGEMVQLTALHPLFELGETSVWVEPGEHLRVELVVQPKARFVSR